MVKKKITVKEVMRKVLFWVFLFCSTASWCSSSVAGNPKTGKNLLFMWWNVENLFDPHNDPATDDDDFTPGGKLHWTEKKLTLKQMRIRHILSAVEAHPDYRKYPDVVAFAEVENRNLFEETLSRIQGIRYNAIYFESSDPRGIDIGLGYNPRTLRQGASKAYSIPLEGKATRKIVVAEFSAARHPLYVILNHWPSRSFDTQWTEPKRLAAASVARHIIDSLLVGNKKADIIIMGDFNDEPVNRSMNQVLGSSFDATKVRNNGNRLLYNCWSGYRGIGSYSYHKQWQHIDQILLSSGMLDRIGLSAPRDAFRCFSFSRMLDDSRRKPWPTYEKREYQGGYSDHLPLLLKVDILP